MSNQTEYPFDDYTKPHSDAQKFAFGITALGGKVHESITRQAAKNADLTPYGNLVDGVKWPDVPDDDENKKPNWESYAKLATQIDKPDTIIYDSHHGKYQIWHSMAPDDGTGKVYTNGEVKDLIINQAVAWYEQAQSSGDTFHLGKVLHMVQDSYSRSHVVRDEHGNIKNFQSYNEQDGHAHGLEDKPLIKAVTESNGVVRQVPGDWREVPGALQALEASTAILKLYKSGASSKVLADYLRDQVYPFENEQTRSMPAGGSDPKYQKQIAEEKTAVPLPSRQQTIAILAIDRPNLALNYAGMSAALLDGHEHFSGMSEANRFALAEMIKERALNQTADIAKESIIVSMNIHASKSQEYEMLLNAKS